jgi:hypothetical protein
MTDAKINLLAAVITLAAAIITVVCGIVKWATGKGLVRPMLLSIVLLVGVGCFVTAGYGRFVGGWTRGDTGAFLVAYTCLMSVAFALNPGPAGRVETAFFVMQVALALSLA